ncbi:MAG TPA: SDR family oxidoreductase [Verrucomicrobiae bacterium]|nr:SDR family oxidoreductase [Verrucomicrobiae bacterium]
MNLNLTGRTALVTGGSRGIGFEIGRQFAAEGCHLCLAARSIADLEAAARTIRESSPVNVRTLSVDLSDPAARDKLVKSCPEIDILVNNAGAVPAGTIDEVDDEAWHLGWDLKVFGCISLTRAYLKKMRERRSGVIINVIGTTGERVDASYLPGSMGNAALMAFTRALGSSSPDYGVRILGVNPGPVETERLVSLSKKFAAERFGDESRWRDRYAKMPFGRPATGEEIAATVAFLASDRSSYTTGTVVTIDGGVASRGSLP